TVGFGMGNFSDVTMEQLADNGDGFYAYVDNEDEAERLFEDELTSTLLTVAKDAKIQVEFDPDVVESYRLIGFENRGVLDSDFRNDDVDAGELGAGHQVTAIYEVELERGVDLDDRDEIGEVFLRWEDPETGEVSEIDEDIDLRDVEPNWGDTDIDFQLATTVATLAEKLRDNPFADDVDLDAVVEELDRLADEYDTAEVDELADLAERAAELAGQPALQCSVAPGTRRNTRSLRCRWRLADSPDGGTDRDRSRRDLARCVRRVVRAQHRRPH
ncbi:MAG: YfbK domain-containing protein, partial [Actinomycetota bacterium]